MWNTVIFGRGNGLFTRMFLKNESFNKKVARKKSERRRSGMIGSPISECVASSGTYNLDLLLRFGAKGILETLQLSLEKAKVDSKCQHQGSNFCFPGSKSGRLLTNATTHVFTSSPT
jgi:hypothetical protein